MRIPLATDLKTSISDTTKDARLINAHTETRGGVTKVKKRPGALATGWDFTTPIQGLFGGPLLYLIYGDEFEIVDVDNPPPPPPAAVEIGDLVGGYYAMVDNPSTSPGPGDAYWSASPPGADRWRVNFSAESSGYSSADIYPRFVGGKGASTGAAAKQFMEDIAAIPVGVAVLANTSDYSPDAVVETYAFPTPATFTYSESFGQGWVKSDANQKAVLITYPSGWPSAADFSSPSFVANSQVGSMGKRKTKTAFTISATGDVGRLPLSTFTGEDLFGSVTSIEVSGCDQPEYNGEFLAYKIPNPSGFPIGDGYLYFQLSGTPASSPATGASKQLAYYTKI